MAVEFACDDFNAAFAHLELFAEKLYEVGIGFAVNRWGGDGDFQGLIVAFSMPALNLISAGFGLEIDMECEDILFKGYGCHLTDQPLCDTDNRAKQHDLGELNRHQYR